MKVESVYKENESIAQQTDSNITTSQNGVNFEKVAASQKFKALTSKKAKFIVPMSIFFLIFYFMLPILTSYTNILEKTAIGDISWAWIYATAQFIMAWVLCIVYVKKFQSFDKDANDIIESEIKEESR